MAVMIGPMLPNPESMALVLVLLLLLCSFSTISAHGDEDPTIRTMEEFSGYPIHESHSSIQSSVLSLSVDAQSLQKQVGSE